MVAGAFTARVAPHGFRLLAGAVLFAAGLGSAQAGPCTARIDQTQAKLDALIDKTAGAGKAGKESTTATMSRQPTPESIAKAEAALGEGKDYSPALAALDKARAADKAGDAAACGAALDAAQKAMAAN